jgi:hypothetical protein
VKTSVEGEESGGEVV